MVEHSQTIRRQNPTNCLSVFDHFVGLALKGLRLVNLKQTKFLNKFEPKSKLNELNVCRDRQNT